jgi:NADH dehydrogenase
MAYAKVIIIGGGFGGINAAKKLAKADVDLLIIDRTNYHVFQPLLYQVATAALSSGNIAAPIRGMLRHQKNTSVVMAEISNIDLAKRQVSATNGDTFNYDYLIVAPGVRPSYFGHPEWEENAPGLKTLADAERIRERILLAFESAERCDSFTEAANYLRFVIIGGGPTGVEMAGDIATIAHKTMFKNFRKIKPEQAEIYLIEGSSHILGTYPTRLSERAQRDLEKMGVRVITGERVSAIDNKGVYLGNRFIETYNVIWAAGNAASPLLETLGAPLDRSGRVRVEPDMSIKGHPEVFVIGDAACAIGADGQPLPAIAPTAVQQGKYVANLIAKKIPVNERPPFVYFDKGTMATIGNGKAIATLGKLQLTGFIAWMAWAFVHIFYLVSFQHRIIVMWQWFFWYLTGKRQQRIITGPSVTPHDEDIIERHHPTDDRPAGEKQNGELVPPASDTPPAAKM